MEKVGWLPASYVTHALPTGLWGTGDGSEVAGRTAVSVEAMVVVGAKDKVAIGGKVEVGMGVGETHPARTPNKNK